MQYFKIIHQYILSISLLCCSHLAFSQAFRENTRAELDGIKASSVNNDVFVDGIGSSGGQKMKYSQVQGSPFFYDEFHPSDFYDRKNRKIGRYMSRYNLASQKFHYLSTDSVELAVDDGIGRVVVFSYPGDAQHGLEFISDPSKFVIEENPYFGFLQQMNQGNVILYKHLKRSVVVADSLFGAAKKYYFGTTTTYFLGTSSGNIKLKKLSDDYILSNIQLTEEKRNWIRENKIKFNREADVVRFLDYYNSTLK
jgi:hypothetical protein